MTTTTPLRFEFTADATTVARLSRASVRFGLRRGVLPYALIAVMAPILLWLGETVGGMEREAALVLGVVALSLLGAWVAAKVTFALVQRAGFRAGFAPGTTVSVEYGDDVRILGPRDETRIAFSALADVVPREGEVVIGRGVGYPLVLPTELCPPEAQELIRDSIRDGVTAPEVAWSREAAFDIPTTRVCVRRTMTHPTALVMFAPLVLGVAVLALAAESLAGFLVGAVVILAIGATLFRGTAASVRRAYAGQVARIRFDDDRVAIEMRGVRTIHPCHAITHLEDRGPVVIARVDGARLPGILPAALIPQEERARFAAATGVSPR